MAHKDSLALDPEEIFIFKRKKVLHTRNKIASVPSFQKNIQSTTVDEVDGEEMTLTLSTIYKLLDC